MKKALVLIAFAFGISSLAMAQSATTTSGGTTTTQEQQISTPAQVAIEEAADVTPADKGKSCKPSEAKKCCSDKEKATASANGKSCCADKKGSDKAHCSDKAKATGKENEVAPQKENQQ
ncbi:MAG: hypothetical protein IPL22_00940 [Bacteroidetes bacterium]|nr:hypothetical protein [Bacteroidota bacterium]